MTLKSIGSLTTLTGLLERTSPLVREAAMKALRRYLPEIDLEEETIPPEVLEKMEVPHEGFP